MKNKKKKFEWSKLISAIVTGVFGIVSVWSVWKYYSLAQLAIATGAVLLPDPIIATTCITVVIGALMSYFMYQFGLKNSRNKYGVDSEGNPYRQKIEYEEVENTIVDESTDVSEINNNEEALG